MPALQEDRDEIVNAMRGETKSLGLLDTADNCWATFINKVKANLHVAFTASPVGEAFRVRSQVRQWPHVSSLRTGVSAL
jgi:dynein heavy chain